MKKLVLLMAFVTALSFCFAQHHGGKDLSIDKTQVQTARVVDKSERRTGAQPKYKYRIEKTLEFATSVSDGSNNFIMPAIAAVTFFTNVDLA